MLNDLLIMQISAFFTIIFVVFNNIYKKIVKALHPKFFHPKLMLIKITWHQSVQLSVRKNLDADIPMESQTLYKENLSGHPW